MAIRYTILLFVIFLSCSTFAEDHHEDNDPHHDSILHLGTVEVLGEMGSTDLFKTVPTVSNLHGKKLLNKSQNSLGETLKDEVGVNSTQFGPAASRPVIRGLEGDRIRILQNGIGVLDASGTSQDHAVPMNPLTAESLEVVRGPINLLYGSSAIGGVVNIVNSRIHKNYFKGLYSSFDTKYDSANQGQNVAAKVDYGFRNTMVHFDGYYLKADNTETPLGEIDNSETEQHSLATGVTFFSKNKSYLGLSYSTFQNIYGVVSEPDVDIQLNQNRIDLAGAYKVGGFFKHIQFKSAQSFYKHTEFEGTSTGTVFENSGNETRIELVQNNQGAFSGILGLQTQILELSALGDEAFLPSTEQKSISIFAFEEWSSQSVKINAGLRTEFTQLDALSGSILATNQSKDFTSLSVAMGGLYAFGTNFSTTLNASLNQRAPTYQELYAGGPHLAVGIYEQGNANLKLEESLALEVSLKYKNKALSTVITAFNQDFNNFVALTPSGTFHDTDESGIAGDSSDDFEINNYLSQKARINGLEIESQISLSSHLNFRVMGDYLYGQNTDTNTPLPRISPIRLGAGLTYLKNNFQSGIEWRNVFKQTRIAPGETPTDSYNLLNLNIQYQVNIGAESIANFYLQANNLFDATARNHVSIIKDKVLLPGRNFVLGARVIF